MEVSSNAVPLALVQDPPEIGLKDSPFNSVKSVGALRPFTVKERSLMACPFAKVPDSVLVRVISIPPATGANTTVAASGPSLSEPATVVNVTGVPDAWALGAMITANSKAMIQIDFRIMECSSPKKMFI